MQATIDTMFVNEKIIRMYIFCPRQDKHFKRSIVTKTSHLRKIPAQQAPPQKKNKVKSRFTPSRKDNSLVY